ncbi:Uncharacterised protein [Wolbachia endosymbiont wPip_Mol of Culex molestus]|nr:Uncharacterised protein [Wolbachia endosymbiont wPip_Mol of Culex molestus]
MMLSRSESLRFSNSNVIRPSTLGILYLFAINSDSPNLVLDFSIQRLAHATIASSEKVLTLEKILLSTSFLTSVVEADWSTFNSTITGTAPKFLFLYSSLREMRTKSAPPPLPEDLSA